MSVTVYKNEGVSIENRAPSDFYPTPQWAIDAASHLLPTNPGHVLDAGAGDGRWGYTLAARALSLTGVEMSPDFPRHPDYDVWHQMDYLKYQPVRRFNTVIGNPPFNLFLEFFKHSWDLLEDDGEIIWLLPLKYLQGQDRYRYVFAGWRLRRVSTYVNRIDFSGAGNPHDQHAVFTFSKAWNRPYYHGDFISDAPPKASKKNQPRLL